jgi:hypothetical protein
MQEKFSTTIRNPVDVTKLWVYSKSFSGAFSICDAMTAFSV